MLITTNFANVKKFRGDRYSIALVPPKGVKLIPLKDLWPTKKMVSEYKSGRITWDQYTEQYNFLLDNCKWLLSKIKEMAMEDDVVLVCYEKPEDNCHRNLVAERLIEQYELPRDMWKKC